MDDVECAKRKIAQLRAEIGRLRTSDFHHPRVKECLDLIEGVFDRDLRLLDRLDSDVALDARQWACGRVNRDLARCHRVLGIILRSTNARNSFEIFDPLLRITKALLGDGAMLILSSEWEFSPFADPLVITELKNYVFVGLPVSEAANSLLIPLAGHELGHSVWRERKTAPKLRSEMQRLLLNQFLVDSENFEKRVDHLPSKISSHLTEGEWEGLTEKWWWLFSWGALERICEEIFCDFMGICIFGDSYLCAFMYLVSPHAGVTDIECYPALGDRAQYISYARRRLGTRALKLQVPRPYSRWFREPLDEEQGEDERLVYSDEERYLLGETHRAARLLLPNILYLAKRECESAMLPSPDGEHAQGIYKRLCSSVPAERIRKRGIGDIINGGWMAFLDPELWAENDRKFENINQLVFKSLEVMEFEERTNASEVRRTRKEDRAPLAQS